MQNCIFRNHTTKWSGIEGKQQWVQNWPLKDSKERWTLKERQSFSSILRDLPVRYDLNQSNVFLVTPNQSTSLLKRVEWSMVSKAGERSSKVSAVTLQSSIDEKISLCIWRRALSVERNYRDLNEYCLHLLSYGQTVQYRIEGMLPRQHTWTLHWMLLGNRQLDKSWVGHIHFDECCLGNIDKCCIENIQLDEYCIGNIVEWMLPWQHGLPGKH